MVWQFRHVLGKWSSKIYGLGLLVFSGLLVNAPQSNADDDS